jgi:hypothetical protein
MLLRRPLTVLSVTALVVLVGTVAPQAASVQWVHKAGKTIDAVAVDAAGNTYAVGTTLLGSGKRGAILLKYGPAGTKLWSRIWFPPAADLTRGTAVTVAPDGSVYWGGDATPPGCEGDGWFVRKVGSDGGLLWHRDQRGWQHCKVATILSDIDASAQTVVFSVSDHGCCGDPYADGWVRAFTPGGDPRWKAQFEPPASVPHRFFDRASGIALGGLGRVFVAGWAATERIGSPETTNHKGIVLIEKIAPDGSILWSKRARRINDSQTDAAISVRGDRVMVATRARAGQIRWGGRPPAAWLGRFSVAGDRVWARTWGIKWRFGAEPAQLSIDSKLSTWVVGTRRDPTDRGLDMFLRRYSPGGDVTWSRTLDGPTRYFHGTGVSAGKTGVSLSGAVGSQRFDDIKSGRVIRVSLP